jgi:hypothetical protein
MRIVLLASIALLIAAPLAAQGTRVAGYETYAVVAPVADPASALPFAELHCAKYDRFAHFRRMDSFKAVFDCRLQRDDGRPLAPTGRGLY